MSRLRHSRHRRGFLKRVAPFAPLCAMFLAACGQGPQREAWDQGEAMRASPANSSPDRYDLQRDENRGGHTLDRHVARTDAQLQERLEQERNISAASTWTDQIIAEQTVSQGLRAERGRIEGWVQRGYPRANLALHFAAGREIGRSLRRGESQPVPCTDAVIVLRGDGGQSFYVLTAYPEARE